MSSSPARGWPGKKHTPGKAAYLRALAHACCSRLSARSASFFRSSLLSPAAKQRPAPEPGRQQLMLRPPGKGRVEPSLASQIVYRFGGAGSIAFESSRTYFLISPQVTISFPP